MPHNGIRGQQPTRNKENVENHCSKKSVIQANQSKNLHMFEADCLCSFPNALSVHDIMQMTRLVEVKDRQEETFLPLSTEEEKPRVSSEI